MNILLLMMGGSGTRLESDIPKQYISVNNRPLFSYILEQYDHLEYIDAIVVISREDWIEYVQEWVFKIGAVKVRKIVSGGDSRSESVRNGLEVAAEFAAPEDVVLIHDATHPYVDSEGVCEVIKAVNEYGGATLGQFQYDTCYQMDSDLMVNSVIPRSEIVSGASPEAFKFGEIYDIYARADKEELDSMTSAGAIALANGISMKVIPCNVLNLKITYDRDLALFKKLCNSYFFDQGASDNA